MNGTLRIQRFHVRLTGKNNLYVRLLVKNSPHVRLPGKSSWNCAPTRGAATRLYYSAILYSGLDVLTIKPEQGTVRRIDDLESSRSGVLFGEDARPQEDAVTRAQGCAPTRERSYASVHRFGGECERSKGGERRSEMKCVRHFIREVWVFHE